MSTSNPTSPPLTPPRPLPRNHDRSRSQFNSQADSAKLQIRIVPYSPPRLSSDGSVALSATSSRPVSYADSDTGRHSRSYAISAEILPDDAARGGSEPRQVVLEEDAGVVGGGFDRPGVSDSPGGSGRDTPNVEIHSDQRTTPVSFPSVLSTDTLGTPDSGMNCGNDAGDGNHPGLAVNAHSPSTVIYASPTGRPNSAASSTSSRATEPHSRRKRVITLHADNKTFSLAPLSGSLSSRTDSFHTGSTTGPPSLATPRSSYGRVSSAFFSDDRPVSPLTSLGEHPSEYYEGRTGSPASTTTSLPDPNTASSWHPRLGGGLRKVGQDPADKPEPSPESGHVDINPFEDASHPGPSTLSVSDRRSTSKSPELPKLEPKASFQSSVSSQSDSTLSERTNYKVYGQSSPVVGFRHNSRDLDTPLPSSSHSDVNFRVLGHSSPVRQHTADGDPLPPSPGNVGANYEVLGQSSPVRRYAASASTFPSSPGNSDANYQVFGESSSPEHSLYEQRRPQTGDSDQNYVVHRQRSASSIATTKSRLRPEYSQESLVVPPLRPGRKSSLDSFRLATKRSRDTLRSGSLTSLGSVLTQEAARALFIAPASIYVPASIRKHHSRTPSSSTAHGNRSMLESHPHQWSSQLSTVQSESEPSSRSLSPVSETARRSSGFLSFRSHRMRSISSSLAGPDETASRSGSQSLSPVETVERPQATYVPLISRDASLSSPRLIRDHDEDGDGLADLEDLRHRPSRSRLSTLMSHQSSDRDLRSAGSSRANSLTSTLPGWARLYYGSGERRFVISHPSSESMYSLYNESPRSSFLNRTPSMERFMIPVRSPRRRPREQQQSVDEQPHPQSSHDQAVAAPADNIVPVSGHPVMQIARRIRKQTSSIWSPHLGYDRRASRYSIWEPPSTTWSEEAGAISRRNMQVILFIAGFVFPIAWMIAALLPLPPAPRHNGAEIHQNTQGDEYQKSEPQYYHTIEDMRYANTRWWRNLNRIMSVVGLLVMGAIVALAIIGARQRWRA